MTCKIINNIVTPGYAGPKLNKTPRTGVRSPLRYFASEDYMQDNTDYIVNQTENNDYFLSDYMQSNVDYVDAPLVAMVTAPLTTVIQSADNGEFTAYEATGYSTDGFVVATDEGDCWTTSKVGVYFKVSTQSATDTIVTGFIAPMLASALGVNLYNDSGTMKASLGNLASADYSALTDISSYYTADDICCIALDSDAGTYGTVYFYHQSDYTAPKITYALTEAVTAPTRQGFYFTNITGIRTCYIVENPVTEFTGVTQFKVPE